MTTQTKTYDQVIPDNYKFGFHDDDIEYSFRSKKGLSRSIVADISRGDLEHVTEDLECFHAPIRG